MALADNRADVAIGFLSVHKIPAAAGRVVQREARTARARVDAARSGIVPLAIATTDDVGF